jgi:hypothetical protein
MSKPGSGITLPPSLSSAAQKLAEEDGLSLSQWVAIVVAQKIGSIETAVVFFRSRAQGADSVDFLEILRSAPDRKPDSGDELEA